MPSSLLRNSFNGSSSQKIIPSTVAQSVIHRFGAMAFGAVLVLGGVLTIGSSASAMGIDGWKYDPEKGQVEFEIEDGVKPRHFLMAQPARIVVDLVNTQIGNAPAEMSYSSGPVQRITVVQLQPLLTRVTLHMFPSTVFAKGQVAIDRLGDGNRGTSDIWTLRPLINSPGSMPATIKPGSSTPSQIQLKTETQTLTLPTAPISQSIPIAVPPAKSDADSNASVPSIDSRLGSIQPATPPKLEELPPGMSSVVLSQKPGSVGFTPVSPAIASPNVSLKPVALPKLETVKPTPPKLEAVQSVAIADGRSLTSEVPKPMMELSKTSVAEPIETPKPIEAAKPEVKSEVIPQVTPQVLAFERPNPSAMSVPQVVNVPPPASTLFSSVPTPPITLFTPDSQIFAKAGDGLVLPDSLPTVTPTIPQPTTVSVPPLSTISPVAQPRVQQPIAPNPFLNLVPNTTPTAFPLPDRVPQSAPSQIQPQPIVPKFTTQPVIQPTKQPSIFPPSGIAQPVDRNPIASSPSSVQPDVISFGEPLRLATPPQSSQPAPIFATIPTTAIVTMTANDGRTGLPSGTALTVRYTGISSLSVKDGSRKEILVLQSAIRDRNGMTIAPEGTTIYGAFEGGTNRFVAESIVIQGQLISLIAESPNLGGARSPSERSLLQNSGIGVLAGVLLGGLSGGSAIGGAAAGAIASYVTAPKVATIQPGQMLELKLTQDWIIPFGVTVSQRVGG